MTDFIFTLVISVLLSLKTLSLVVFGAFTSALVITIIINLFLSIVARSPRLDVVEKVIRRLLVVVAISGVVYIGMPSKEVWWVLTGFPEYSFNP